MELEIRGLGKRYGQKAAVSGVELTITPGVWGLIGANGAGKTTLMRMLAGILAPSAGRVLYDGVDIRDLGEAYRDALGYLPTQKAVDGGGYSAGLFSCLFGQQGGDALVRHSVALVESLF